MLIRFTSQALVSDIKSNAAFAGVTRLNLVILGLPSFSLACELTTLTGRIENERRVRRTSVLLVEQNAPAPPSELPPMRCVKCR
jgi:hypothetical protein